MTSLKKVVLVYCLSALGVSRLLYFFVAATKMTTDEAFVNAWIAMLGVTILVAFIPRSWFDWLERR